MASLPPHSSSTGVSVSAQAAMIFFAVAVEPVKAILSTPDRHSAAPVAPAAGDQLRAPAARAPPRRSWRTSHRPTAGVYSDGLKTTALPAASAYAIEPIGVKTG